tara:strand:- start:4349 stop:5251 length:903 start_codon:yes stop_codon:yes gene_type:complete
MAGLSEIRRAKALVLTSNNAAFPVLFLRSLGLSIPPVLVISVGLEWNPPNDSPRRLRSISKLFRHAEKILVYSESEREFLMERIGIEPHRILAVPFGIPRKYLPAALPPMTSDEEGEVFQWDVISVGADAQRDLPLLLEWARNNPEMRVHLILGDDLVREYTDLLASVTVESNLSVEEVFERIRSSRGAVVPVRENLYSAGTTFLIHALACQTPALVSQTSCLGPQYRISESGCFTYSPGDTEDFSQGMKKLLALSTNERRSRGEQGRRWVETYADGKPALGVLREFLEAHSSSPAKEQN